jgi:hypothetical protein
MNRQSLASNGWIDLDTAKKFAEDTNWNGNNHISVNTGSQWEHEVLYRSVAGTYVLYTWSQCQGSRDTWQRIGIDEAVAWLVRNDYEPDSLAEQAIAAALEV